MTESDDIANLFKHFGGQPDQYREIARSNDAKMSRARWPLLSAVEATQASDAPPVQPHLRGAAPTEPVLATPPAAALSAPQAPVRQEPALSNPMPMRQPAAAPAVTAAAASTVAPAGPGAEFIPPRPRAPARFEHRPPADVAMPFGRMVPEAPTPLHAAPAATPTQPAPVTMQLQQQPAAAPAPAAPAPFAAPSATTRAVSTPPAQPAAASLPPALSPPAPAGLPAQSALAGAPATELQAVFARLAQPLPDAPPTPDKNANLLQRLRRL
ncbi:hypothetical protein GCM10007242_01560 [Pigmentiphaga litoralis]|uniref:cellulose biosynthesis protein BcsP n=1 Tax=Pigmentiphaga litoralis TaxID=516702 RepID=UPI001678CF44|nr:cellulose biosynthesis protein BcsP [Pigmentiphaga litoralis]GGX00450.1 hypothetical protein GCM10007242_01560 [Pigmentiphaga litoralis]